MRVLGIILAGGTGTRFGADVPKQYQMMNGKMVIDYVIEAYLKSKCENVLVVCNSEFYADMLKNKYSKIKTILGGETRNESVYNALDYAREHNYNAVMVHDAARPHITTEYLNECYDELENYDGVVACEKINNSLASYTLGNVNRDDYYQLTGPQCYKLFVLENFDKNATGTSTYSQVDQKKFNIHKNFNFQNNIKLTTPSDKFILELLLKGK